MLSVDELYKEYAKMIYRWLLLKTNDNDLAEELMQETFYQAVKSVHRFDGRSKVTTWLIGIAKNLLYQYWRKNPVMDEFKDYSKKAKSAEEEAIASIVKYELSRVIDQLEEPAKDVIQLRIYAELSFREIGDIMGKTENWARVTFYRAKEKIRKEIDKDA